MVIMAAISITALMARLAVTDIRVLKGFKCSKGFNFSGRSSSCIASNDPNGSYDVLVFMTKMTVMAIIEWPHCLL